MVRTHRARLERHGLLAYFALAFGITWGLGWAGEAAGPPVRGLCLVFLHYGPAFASLTVAGALGGRTGVRGLLRPLIRWRAGVRWYLFVLFFPLAVRLIAVSLDGLLGGERPPFFHAGPESGVPAGVHPALLLFPVFLGVLLQAGLAEEPGWRGFALPRLQSRYGALRSSLLLGLLWALWHYDPSRAPGLLPKGLWYPLSVLAVTVILTWIYNSTQAGLLLAVLFHTSNNVSDWIVPTSNFTAATLVASPRPFILQVVLLCLVALGLILIHGPGGLSREGPAACGADGPKGPESSGSPTAPPPRSRRSPSPPARGGRPRRASGR